MRRARIDLGPGLIQPDRSHQKVRVLGRDFRRRSLFWLLQCAGWTVFGVMMFAWGLAYWNTAEAIANKLLLVLAGFGLTLAFRFVYQRARQHLISYFTSAALIGGLSFCGAVIWTETQLFLFQLYEAVSHSSQAAIELIPLPFGTVVYYTFVLLSWSLLYYGINSGLDLEQQRERTAKAEALAQSARLAALRSQLEPHFLFNTLNAISTLVIEGKNSAAAQMITRLSDFLRLTIETTDAPEISLGEELEFVQRYLEIEQVRFGNRLRFNIDVDPESMKAMVPVLILQPLIENAVKHGVLPREEGGSLTVKVTRDNGTLLLTVLDDGNGTNGNAITHGVGLANTRARLAELYGEKAHFTLESNPIRGIAAKIEIPYRTA